MLLREGVFLCLHHNIESYKKNQSPLIVGRYKTLFALCLVGPGLEISHMSNIHKRIRFVKTTSPIVPLVKDYDLSKQPSDSYHWN